MVRPERFELPTYSSGGCRSIQLSYGRTLAFPVYMRSLALSIRLDQASRSGISRLSRSRDAGLNILICRRRQGLVAIPTAATTTAVSAAAATTIATAATTAASATLDFGTRFIDVERASANLRAIQGRDGFFSVFPTRHFDEAKTARAPCVPVRHDADPVHLPMYLEELAQFVFRSIEIEISNKDVLQANCL